MNISFTKVVRSRAMPSSPSTKPALVSLRIRRSPNRSEIRKTSIETVLVYFRIDSDLDFEQPKNIHLRRLVHRPRRTRRPQQQPTGNTSRIEWIAVPMLLVAMEVTRDYRRPSSPTEDDRISIETSIPMDVHRDEFLLNSTSMAMDAIPTVKTPWKHVTMGHVTTNQRTIKVCFVCLSSVFVTTVLIVLANTDEKIIDYDPNDPNLVDEPYLDVENPYEGLGPGRPDSIARALLPTGGRHSPDSIGQGKNTHPANRALLLCLYVHL